MTWRVEAAERDYRVIDEWMVMFVRNLYHAHHEAVCSGFTEWVNDTYTPFEALETWLDETLKTWAEHIVANRPDIVEGMIPWVHHLEEEE